ncbi:hypothetical protein BUALT_Bualt09G0076700 [Buddleja alternifolia]|uniref:Helicase C-terminal domain-containing protein n=1 Tax=Buddleja alternifolia TaxID=168488 RepID=A0AAV6X1C6_9LAMI|nr:hypothetical protein BUALT_Bualt09G0076700 [Buddleja alternifolia]
MKKLNGQRYKELLKSLVKKAKRSDPSQDKDATTNADISVSCSQEERLDFLLRRVRSSGHAQGSKSTDDITQTNLKKRKKNLLQSPSDLYTSKPKEKLANLVPDECKSTAINFVEYWIPVRLSNVQTEQYCGSLFSNSSLLCSSSKSDSAEILHDILISNRKCCDHPYLVNPCLRASLIQGIPEPEQLDAEIKLSSKLLLLHKILTEIKKRELRVLILYQSHGGSGPISNGDILDDIIHHKFGEDSFQRIDGGLSRAKKRAVLNSFNNSGSQKFVCLMETRTCVPSIKLASIDTVIFFNSDWDPLNDLRALQKISLDSQFELVKVFRLYSPHTVEEKVLIFAKQGLKLEGNMINIKQSTRHGLLRWGAPYLFKKLDEFHSLSSQDAHSVTSYGDSFVEDVFLEFSTLLPNNSHSNNSTNTSLIMEAEAIEGIYPRTISLLGEVEAPLMNNFEEMIDKKHSNVFWTNLLEGRNPRWRYFSSQSPRTRKIVQQSHDLFGASVGEETASKKSRKVIKSTICETPPICRRRIRTKLPTQDKKRKRSDLCPGGRKYRQRSRKVKCISKMADLRETIASWIHRQRKVATLTRGQIPISPMENDHLPASTTVQDGQEAHGTTGPSFEAQASIDRPVEDSVRLTEDGRGPSNASHASLPNNPGNFSNPPEASQVTYSEVLQSVCKALEMELERLQKEKNQKLKLHEDMKVQTKMACEKEIDEIRKKYDTVLQNVEMAFLEENKVLDSRYGIVCVNKTLAETMTLMKNPTMATPSQVATNSSMEEIYQQISQLFGPTNVRRPEILAENQTISNLPGYSIVQMLNHASASATIPSRSNQPANQPISSLPGYSVVQMMNQASASTWIPSRSNQPAISPEAASFQPAIGQSLEMTNQSLAAYGFDQPTSSQPVAPALEGMIHSLGNFQDGYTVRAPAPHLRHMRPPWPDTSPGYSSCSNAGVIFSPVSFHQVTSRKKQSPQLLQNLPVSPYDN